MKTHALIACLLLVVGTGRMLANPGSGTLNLVTGQSGINTLDVTVSATAGGFTASDTRTTTATGSINVSFDADPATGATTAMTITGGAFQLTDMQFQLTALGFIPVANITTAGMQGTAITPQVPAPVSATANGGVFDATLHQIEINQGSITGEITVTGTPIDSSFADNNVIGTGDGNGSVIMIPGAISPGQRTMQTTVEMPVDFTDNLILDGTTVTVRVQGTIRATGAVILQTELNNTAVSWKQSGCFNPERTAAKLSNALGMDPTETFLYNQDGVGGVDETTGANGKYWMTTSGGTEATAAAAGRVWVIADLGGSFDLGTIKIWNFNWDNTPGSPTSSLNNRGVSQFDILVRNTPADTDNGTSGGTPINLNNGVDGNIDDDAEFNLGTSNQWQEVLSDQSLTQAPNNDTYTGQAFDLTGNTARFVAIRVDSYHGGDGIGLGKVRFITAPTLTSRSPATPTTADPGTRLLLGFSENVTTGTGSVTIRKASDNSLVETIDVTTPGAVVINGRTAAVVRSTTLAPNTAYYINMPVGAFTDLAGNPAAGITGTSAWTFTTSARVPILVENFGSSSDPLNGTSADTFAAAITTAGGSATWAADDDYLQNGVVNGVEQSAAYLNLGSYINAAKGTANGKFELTMTISETTGAWISLGFAAENAPSTTKNFTNVGTGVTTTALGTIVYRAVSSPGELDMFGGGGSANAVDGPDGNTGFRTLTVTLDLTPAGGYNGTNHFGTVTWSDSALGVLGTSYTYTTTRNFGSILVTQANSSKGTINALALYQIPPANTYANWINSFPFTGFVSPDRSTTGDPDNDGLDNALENLFGTSPEVFSQGLTSVSTSSGNLVFRHALGATPAADLTGAYEWSTDLVTWNADEASAGGITVTFAEPVVVTPGAPALVEVTASVIGTPATKVFARFKVTGP